MVSCKAVFAGACVLLLLAVRVQAAPLYTGTLLPANFSAGDLNNIGQIAGTLLMEDGAQHAAIYSSDALLDLGTPGGARGAGVAINDAGILAGDTVVGGVTHAVVYQDGNVRDLGPRTTAHGINAHGDVIGTKTTSAGATAFLYSDGMLTELGHLGSGTSSSAAGINDARDIVGVSSINAGSLDTLHPFLYRDGVMHDLGTLPGYAINRAAGINNAGQVAGFSDGPGLATHAFLYDSGVMTDLGDAGAAYLEVGDINAHGTLVGNAGGTGRPFGFVSVDGALVALNTLVDPALGWDFLGAGSINDTGQIVAFGCYSVTCGAALLTPIDAVPEPGIALLLATGLAAPAMRYRALVRKKRQTAHCHYVARPVTCAA